ncbi:hypothetical protein BCV70DRAFT_236275 [Testicularia cyperi]|uniref:Uncharacterized protein n=1 Tax=Testicularia cyperi TaxID=1882483 RepID=A0A317XUU0_9BASI|nr:hypothetical protein BCV70DRAFT_236275 [Testicularia cyperi]
MSGQSQQLDGVANKSNDTQMQRQPTWANFSFDDGFDLKTAHPGDFAMPDITATSTAVIAAAEPDHIDHSKGMAQTKTTTLETKSSADADTSWKHAAGPVSSSSSSNKDLPRPPDSKPEMHGAMLLSKQAEVDITPSSSRTTLPPSQSSSSTVQGATAVSTPPQTTPKTRQKTFGSPIVTAATPEQKQRPNPSVAACAATRPVAPAATRSQSTGLATLEKPVVPIHRPFSSADAYMQPVEVLQDELSSRPGTAMSHLSGSGWMHDGTGNRSSYGTTTSNAVNQTKRASVLSFQTAISGGFISGDEGRSSDRGDDVADNLEAPSRAATSDRTKPWLDKYYSGYGSSPDERTVPGALPGSFWDESFAPVAAVAPALPAKDTTPLRQSTGPTGVAGSQPVPLHIVQGAKMPLNVSADSLFATAAVSSRDPSLTPITTQQPLLSAVATSSPSASPITVIAASNDNAQSTRHAAAGSVALTAAEVGADSCQSARGTFQTGPLAPAPPPKDITPSDAAATSAKIDSDSIREGNAADNVIPPPLPAGAAQGQSSVETQMLMLGATDQRPVSDFRKKPLADISPAQKAAGLAHLQAQAESAMEADAAARASLNPSKPEATVVAMMERARRKSTASLTANTALAQPAANADQDLADRTDDLSLESPSREPSPPPDGEVEARAEWERRQMERKAKKEQFIDTNTTRTGRNDTFKGQLKPLQLVPADNLNSLTDRRGLQASAPMNGARATTDRHLIAVPAIDADKMEGQGPTASASSAGPIFSTQQLQKLQAREQRRSVGAFSAAMAAANVVSSGNNGPYPVFASPASAPQKVGARQYPGLMAQRSLVPPFELQHRPDGLPSGLIGPDGVRRSINDPEVCLECMMRDEDMIDVRVLGEGVWERESDKYFEEAVRIEAEEDARLSGIERSSESRSSGHGGGSHNSHREAGRVRSKVYKRIGKGDPLTVERLKLHTSMNPPASSFRWRTLQTFLAVQAKYIAMEQARMRAEADKKRQGMAAAGRSLSSAAPYSAVADFEISAGPPDAPIPPVRDASAISRQRLSTGMLQPMDTSAIEEASGLLPTAAPGLERSHETVPRVSDSRMPAAGPSIGSGLISGVPSYPNGPLQIRTPDVIASGQPGPVAENPRSGTAAGAADDMTASRSRRSTSASMQAARAASAQDLRSSAASSRSPSAFYPSSPAESLLPPSRSYMGASPTTPSRLNNRSGASQLSFMHSGSMIDMHVAQEDGIEHRIKQNGFVPGTPMAVESPAALSRSFYGFPGDGESALPDAAAFDRSRMVSADGYVNPQEAGPTGLDLDRDNSTKRKKKGLRGLLSKLAGSGGSAALSRENSQGPGGGSQNGSIASRNASRRSQASTSPRLRQNSISADRSMDLVPPANMTSFGGVLGKARKSTSTLFNSKNGTEVDIDSKARSQLASPGVFQSPPGMASQSSLELGPFQPASPTAAAATDAARARNGQQLGPNPPSASEAARIRKASNSMIQKYLNSPSLQMAGSPGLSSGFGSIPGSRTGSAGDRAVPPSGPIFSTDARNGRITSFASMKELRSPPLQPIPDMYRESTSSADLRGAANTFDNRTMPASGSRLSQASSRKELPTMPAGVEGSPFMNGLSSGGVSTSSAPQHQRDTSSTASILRTSIVGPTGSPQRSSIVAPAPALGPGLQGGLSAIDPPGRRSMQASRTGITVLGNPMPLIADDASINSNGTGPVRPPRNPRRPEGSVKSSSVVDLQEALNGAPSRRDFPSAAHNDADAFNPILNEPEGKDKSVKSKLLRFGFRRKKRESTIGGTQPTIVVGDGIEHRAETQTQAGTSSGGGGLLPKLRNRKSYAGLGGPKRSFQIERQRVLSSPAGEMRDMPPRSQSAFGMLPTQRFVSMDGRRSMNVSRSARLSTMMDNDEEEDDEDDEMEREPGYEAEFNRYEQEAMANRMQNGRGGPASFGRRSLNLLREGFRMPMRQPSGDQKKRLFG